MKKTKAVLLGLGGLSLGFVGIALGGIVQGKTAAVHAATTTASSTIATIASAKTWVSGTAYTSWTLDGNITISTTGTGNSGKYYSTAPGTWRLYQTGSGNLIITAGSGYKLTSVTATYSVSNTGTLTGLTSATATAVSGSSVTYVVGNTGTATNGIVQISAISVTYDVDSGPSISLASPVSLDANASGTFTATTANVTSPTITWSSSDENVVLVTAATGEYIAGDFGTATITASMTVSGTTYTATSTVNVSGPATIAQANEVGSALPSGATTSYKLTVNGTISAVADKAVTISDGTNTLLIYGTYSPNNASSKGWGVGGSITFIGNITNYQGKTVEMASPSMVSYTGNALALSNFVMMANTANQCTTQFPTAKTQYLAMSTTEQNLFKTATAGEDAVITNARARYLAWAVNRNDANPFASGSLGAASITNVDDGKESEILVIALGALALFASGGFFFLKKKEQR